MELRLLGVQLTLEDYEDNIPAWVLERLEIFLMIQAEYKASQRQEE